MQTIYKEMQTTYLMYLTFYSKYLVINQLKTGVRMKISGNGGSLLD